MPRRLVLLLCLLAVSLPAVEPLYRVDADVIFLPGDGVALNAHTGRLLWRFPRLNGAVAGAVYSDGQGLLLVSWTDDIQPALGLKYTRVCRLRTADGQPLWCRDWPGVEAWTADSGGRIWYLHTAGRLQIVDMSDGQTDSGFHLTQDENLTLLPLPTGGVLLFSRHARGGASALLYRPGAAALVGETLPATVYPFRGNGRGLIFYLEAKGEFFRADPFTSLIDGDPAPSRTHPFPIASLDEHGFLLTDWQGSEPVLRGGTYAGRPWHALRPDDAALQLAVTATTAVMLDLQRDTTRITAWDLASGRRRFALSLPGRFPTLAGEGDDLVLRSDDEIDLLDAGSGACRWRAPGREGPLAAIASTAVVFWESDGDLIGVARNNGALLWRLRLQTPRHE